MNPKKTGIAILVVAVIAATIGTGAALTGGEPQWKQALELRSEWLNRKYQADVVRQSEGIDRPAYLRAMVLRSEALNRIHGLGERPKQVRSAATAPQWIQALQIRSEELNKRYGLGRYARKPASVEQPAWLQALIVRSEALNRQYGLGEYAPKK